ncbi:hypothetical protein OAP74_00490 [bacterium]|nr:hypothetical protein [bacterium]
MIENDLAPPLVFGKLPHGLTWNELDWLHDIPGNNFFALWLRGGALGDPDLPPGYDNYILSYHMEPLDWHWLNIQTKNIDGRIIIINDGQPYNNFDNMPNVSFYTFYSWHYQLQQIYELFPSAVTKNHQYKVSAINNRVTQHKLIIFTAIMELIEDQSLVKLGNNIEPKDVNFYQPTGYEILDDLTVTFRNKYHGKTIEIDKFTNNTQRYNSDPFGIAYTDATLHFSLETQNYSYMQDDYGTYIRTGPHLSEKTLKCLLGETAFIPVSQFDVYNQLQQLGFMFDYGPLDLSFDRDTGNLSRLEKIVELCKTINIYTIDELLHYTKESSEHNREHIISGDFGNLCKQANEQTANKVITELS